MNRLKNRLPYRFILFASLLLVAIFIVENINHRFWLNDFKVYYGAAQALMQGTPVYGTLFALGSGYYKYSPFTMLLVLPLSYFSYPVACIFQYLFLAITIITLFVVSGYIIDKYFFESKIKNKNFLLGIAFVCVINHLVRELHLGNINVVLLLLLCFSLLFILQSKFILPGILIAVVIITKPFFGLMIIPLLLHKYYKTIISFGISMVIFVISPAIITGFSGNIELHKQWFQTLLEHNSSFPSNNTIDNLMRSYLSEGLPAAFQWYVIALACAGVFVFFLINRNREKQLQDNNNLKNKNFIMEWFLLIAIMPSLFRTDTQHFLLSLPLLMLLLVFISLSGKKWLTLLFILLVFLFGGNSSDLIGKVLAAKFDVAGVLGISNLLLITWVLIIYYKSLSKKEITA